MEAQRQRLRPSHTGTDRGDLGEYGTNLLDRAGETQGRGRRRLVSAPRPEDGGVATQGSELISRSRMLSSAYLI
jgi:hypothetical protein